MCGVTLIVTNIELVIVHLNLLSLVAFTRRNYGRKVKESSFPPLRVAKFQNSLSQIANPVNMPWIYFKSTRENPVKQFEILWQSSYCGMCRFLKGVKNESQLLRL
jgi:hypothetical protein